MPGNSITLVPTQVHPGDSTPRTYTSESVRGDGFYGRSDGFHTVQINVQDFTGDITFQGTLVPQPEESDWFTIMILNDKTPCDDSTLYFSDDSTTTNIMKNFIGNYVWVRAYVNNWTTGNIHSILLNH